VVERLAPVDAGKKKDQTVMKILIATAEEVQIVSGMSMKVMAAIAGDKDHAAGRVIMKVIRKHRKEVGKTATGEAEENTILIMSNARVETVGRKSDAGIVIMKIVRKQHKEIGKTEMAEVIAAAEDTIQIMMNVKVVARYKAGVTGKAITKDVQKLRKEAGRIAVAEVATVVDTILIMMDAGMITVKKLRVIGLQLMMDIQKRHKGEGKIAAVKLQVAELKPVPAQQVQHAHREVRMAVKAVNMLVVVDSRQWILRKFVRSPVWVAVQRIARVLLTNLILMKHAVQEEKAAEQDQEAEKYMKHKGTYGTHRFFYTLIYAQALRRSYSLVKYFKHQTINAAGKIFQILKSTESISSNV